MSRAENPELSGIKELAPRFSMLNFEMRFSAELGSENPVRDLYSRVMEQTNLGSGRKSGDRPLLVEIVLANLINASVYGPEQCVGILLGKSGYRKADPFVGYGADAVRTVVTTLSDAGFIALKKGTASASTAAREPTKICLSKLERQRLQSIADSQPAPVEFAPSSLVIMKDARKERVDWGDEPDGVALAEKLRRINEVHSKSTLTFVGETGRKLRMSPHLYAVFSNSSWAHGGRLYTRGRGWQNIHSQFRPFIEIDGCSTCEKDYRAIHPALLYARAGKSYSGDPYADAIPDCWDLSDQHDEPYIKTIEPKVARDFIKTAFNAMLNVESEAEAVTLLQAQREENLPILQKIGVSARSAMTACVEAHPEIAQWFYQGIGLELQNQDSKIALAVVTHFTEQGICCLPVHDSFIVQEQYTDELVSVMKSSFEQFTGGYSIAVK